MAIWRLRKANLRKCSKRPAPISNLVGKLKGKSSYMLRREYWERVKTMLWGKHFWSPSYCVVSCGGASLDVVREYINNQSKPPSERAVKQSKAISMKK